MYAGEMQAGRGREDRKDAGWLRHLREVSQFRGTSTQGRLPWRCIIADRHFSPRPLAGTRTSSIEPTSTTRSCSVGVLPPTARMQSSVTSPARNSRQSYPQYDAIAGMPSALAVDKLRMRRPSAPSSSFGSRSARMIRRRQIGFRRTPRSVQNALLPSRRMVAATT